MIVECPACHTRYRTDNTALIDEDTLFECSQAHCQHVFSYTPSVLHGGERQTTPSAPPPSLARQPDDFFADDSPANDPSDGPDELPPPSSAAHPASTTAPPITKPLRNERFDEPESFSVAEPSFSDGPFFDKEFDEPEQFLAPEAPFFVDEEDGQDIEMTLPHPMARQEGTAISSPRPIFIFLGCILLGYAALAAYSLRHIADTETALSRLPVLGSLFSGERFSARHISLVNLKGGFWTTKENRRVFAISGKAVNNALLPARSIQIEGALYDAEGKVIGQRIIFCGTDTLPTALESLTIREIGILQNLVPPKQFNVAAGETVNFLIVFTTPPTAVAEFSSRVLAAQFGAP